MDEQVPGRRGGTVVIPHGIDAHFVNAADAPSPLGSGYVLYVSILNYYKAQVEVIEAWAELRKRRETREKLGGGYTGWPYGKDVRRRIAELDSRTRSPLASIPYPSCRAGTATLLRTCSHPPARTARSSCSRPWRRAAPR